MVLGFVGLWLSYALALLQVVCRLVGRVCCLIVTLDFGVVWFCLFVFVWICLSLLGFVFGF